MSSCCRQKFLDKNPRTGCTEPSNFQITSLSATNLPNIRHIGRMRVYAEVALNGDSKTAVKTSVDKEGVTNPKWNYFHASFMVNETSDFIVKLYCDRTRGDKCIATVQIPIKDLLGRRDATFPIDGAANGSLHIHYTTSLWSRNDVVHGGGDD